MEFACWLFPILIFGCIVLSMLIKTIDVGKAARHMDKTEEEIEAIEKDDAFSGIKNLGCGLLGLFVLLFVFYMIWINI